jgi:hypothetical protein
MIRDGDMDGRLSLPWVPSDRRLEKKASVFDQVGYPQLPGTDRELNLRLILGDDVARGISSRFFMDDTTIAVVDRVLKTLGFEQNSAARFIALGRRHLDR